MMLLTPETREALCANDHARRAALAKGEREPDPIPVVRFFNPVGQATWLATEIDLDGVMFGLADLGFGCPELGSFALDEMEAIRLPFGLGIERDIGEGPRAMIGKAGDLAAGMRAVSIGLAGRRRAWSARRHPARNHAFGEIGGQTGVIVLDRAVTRAKAVAGGQEADTGQPAIGIDRAPSLPKRPIIALPGGHPAGIVALGRRAGENEQAMREAPRARLRHIDPHNLDRATLGLRGKTADQGDIGVGADAAHADGYITVVEHGKHDIEEQDPIPEIAAILPRLDRR